MKKLLLAAVAISGLSLAPFVIRADEPKGDKDNGHLTGVLIDNKCGDKQKDEKSAMKHPVKCSLKDACAASGFQLIVGDKHYHFGKEGDEKAKEFLGSHDSNFVTVDGKVEGEDKMKVESIMPAEHRDHDKDSK
jgi:hypothetical protein